MKPFAVLFRVSKISTYIVIAELIHGMVDGSIRTTAYLLHDGILVDGMVRSSVRIVTGVFGSRIEGFLQPRQNLSALFRGSGGEERRRTLTFLC